MAKKTKLHYGLDGGSSNDYIEISCHDDAGRETSIITNRVGNGLFVWSDRDRCYRQVRGTCQFHLPTSASGKRKLLRRWWEAEHERKSDYGWL